MKCWFAFFFSLILMNCTSAVKNDVDETVVDSLQLKNTKAEIEPVSIENFKKFSVPVIVLDKDDKFITDATGFFLKYNKKLFFITNKHVAYHKNSAAYLQVILGNGISHIIPLAAYPKDSFNEKSTKVDLAAFVIDDTKIDYPEVSKFLDLKYQKKKPEEYFIWGYPGDTLNHLETRAINITLLKGKYLNEDSIWSKFFPGDKLDKNFSYSYTYDVRGRLIIPFDLFGGFSGSPIFGIFKAGGSEKMVFMGIANLGFPKNRIGMGIPAADIISYLNSK